MFCDKCGAGVSSDSKFCSGCGKLLDKSGKSVKTLQPEIVLDEIVAEIPKSNKGLIIALVVLLGLLAIVGAQVFSPKSSPTDSSKDSINSDSGGGTAPDSSALLEKMSWKDLSCGVTGSPYITITNGNDEAVYGSISVAWRHGDGTVAGTSGASGDFLANSDTRLKIEPPQGSISFATCEVFDFYLY